MEVRKSKFTLMLLKNIMLSFIFKEFCLSYPVLRSGYLCDGEIENGQSQEIVLERLSVYLGRLVDRPDQSFSSNHIYTIRITPKEDSKKFKYIVMHFSEDCNHAEEIILCSTFVFSRKNQVHKGFHRILGFLKPSEGELCDTKPSRDLYEVIILKLKAIFSDLLENYKNGSEEFEKRIKNYKSKIQQCDRPKTKKSKEDPGNLFLNQLDCFVGKRKMNPKDLENHFSVRGIKFLIENTNQEGHFYNEKDLKLYIERCYAMMNEASAFYQHELYSGYELPREDLAFTMTMKRVLIFIFDKKNQEETIEYSDLFFRGIDGRSYSLTSKDIMIYTKGPRLYVLVYSELLISKGVQEVLIDKYKFNIRGYLRK